MQDKMVVNPNQTAQHLSKQWQQSIILWWLMNSHHVPFTLSVHANQASRFEGPLQMQHFSLLVHNIPFLFQKPAMFGGMEEDILGLLLKSLNCRVWVATYFPQSARVATSYWLPLSGAQRKKELCRPENKQAASCFHRNASHSLWSLGPIDTAWVHSYTQSW